VAGVEAMWAARAKARRERDLASGPAKLCQALGIGRAQDGADLLTGDRGVTLLDDGTPPPAGRALANGVRIGVAAGAEQAWRWWVAGDPHVSRSGPGTLGKPGPVRPARR
jgi:DNA-3-methyladenine glycosylase